MEFQVPVHKYAYVATLLKIIWIKLILASQFSLIIIKYSN